MTEDRQRLTDEEPTLNDPANKTQPAEGGREEAEDGGEEAPATEPD